MNSFHLPSDSSTISLTALGLILSCLLAISTSVIIFFVSRFLVQFSSVAQLCLFVTPWTAACQASLPITNSQSLLKLMSIESVMPSNHLVLCRPLLPLPSIFPSIRLFSNASALCIRRPKDWRGPLGTLATVTEQVFSTQVLDMRLLPHTGPHICRRHSAGTFHSLSWVGGCTQGPPLSSCPHPSGGALSVTVTVATFMPLDPEPSTPPARTYHCFLSSVPESEALGMFRSVAVTSVCSCHGFGAEKKPQSVNLQCHVVQKSRKFISLSSYVSLSPILSPTLWGGRKFNPSLPS